MIANYHTHTTRCNHAYGTEREYVENAVSRGLKIFGFAEKFLILMVFAEVLICKIVGQQHMS